jgi:hypothetical protein
MVKKGRKKRKVIDDDDVSEGGEGKGGEGEGGEGKRSGEDEDMHLGGREGERSVEDKGAEVADDIEDFSSQDDDKKKAGGGKSRLFQRKHTHASIDYTCLCCRAYIYILVSYIYIYIYLSFFLS